MKKINLLGVLTALTMSFYSTAQASEVSNWEANYRKLVKILKATKSVGECSTSISGTGDAANPRQVALNILTTDEGLRSMVLDSPMTTRGESRVEIGSAQALYSVSDIGGWTNLAIYFDAQKKVAGLQMYKTLPSGEVYNAGAKCGRQPIQ